MFFSFVSGKKRRSVGLWRGKRGIFSDVSASVKLGWLTFMWNFHSHFVLYANVKSHSMLCGTDWLAFFPTN